jgi:hypothetical protein
VLFTLPIWIATHPPMADYPQHLSMASVLRWYDDPARLLSENYALAFTRPNTAFVILVAALSYVMPLGMAGKLLMSLSVVATGLAGLALARRTGRPGWYGLFALLSVYNFAFFFGFVNNVIATPLFLYGIVLTDRMLDRPVSFHSWLLLATSGCAFYFVHLQFLFLYVGAVGWLTITRHRGWSDSLWRFSSLVVGVTLVLLYYFMRNEETYGYHEKQIFSTNHESALIFDKLIDIPDYVFGVRGDGKQWLLLGLAVLAGLLVYRVRLRPQVECQESREPLSFSLVRARVVGSLERTRFHSLTAWIFALYLLMPHVFVGVFIYQRLIAVACLLIPAVLPLPDPTRLRPAKLVLTASLVMHLVLTSDDAYTFHLETRGGHELIAKTEPGKKLMPLMIRLGSMGVRYPPLAIHFGSNYLAKKGGRVFFSFSELHITMVQLRPGLAFDDQDATMNEWQPWLFRFDDFGYHYDYFLYYGDITRMAPLFGKSLAKMAWEIRDDWVLLWRKPEVVSTR